MAERDFAESGEILLTANKIIIDGLAPFVESVLATKYAESPNQWLDVVNHVRQAKKPPQDELKRRRDNNTVRWDIPKLCGAIDDFWPVFREVFEQRSENTGITTWEVRRSIIVLENSITLLRDLRNRASHFPAADFSEKDRNRILDLAEHFLRAAGLDGPADSIQALAQICPKTIVGDELIRSAVASSAIRLLREEFRGLELDERAMIERISPGERIRIEIDLAAEDLRYGLVLVVDPAEVVCLMPSARIAPYRQFSNRLAMIPDPDVTSHALRFKGTLGRHVLLALLTRAELPEHIYLAMNTPQPRGFLNRIQEVVEKLKAEERRLMKMEFDVG